MFLFVVVGLEMVKAKNKFNHIELR